MLDLLVNFVLELFESSLQRGGCGRSVGQDLRDSRTIQAGMNAGEVQGRAQAKIGDAIAVRLRYSFDHTVQP